MIETALPRLVESLVEILSAQSADFGRLLRHIGDGEEAVRTADVKRLLDTCREERVIAARLQELERHRQDLLNRIREAVSPGTRDTSPIRMIDLCRQLPEAYRPQLEEASGRLRGLAEETGRRSAVLRAAATTLCRHLGGVIQTVNASLSATGPTYGPGGRIDSPDVRHAMLDVRR
ncbi:MAG: flagellar export chaperone FlgN [Phycisphaerales bacterium]|nr:flagellar export chaperone FlgN [Phycisphaerales bacterium]